MTTSDYRCLHGTFVAVRAWLLIGLLAHGGCVLDINHGGTRYRCDENPTCPDGLECLDGLCVQEDADAGTSAGDAGGDGAAAPRLGGDILYVPFGDSPALQVVHDRSGRGYSAAPRGPLSVVEGRFGDALYFEDDGGARLMIPDNPGLYLGSALTIEMWLSHDDRGEEDFLFGDYAPTSDGNAPVEIGLAITAANTLKLMVSDGCDGGLVEADSSVTVPEATWVHVAATWDGSEARIYLDGVLANAAPLVATPCESVESRAYHVGWRPGGDGFQGVIDELRVSSFVKSQADIELSMTHDSAQDISACGDRVIDAEACDSDTPCCDAAACELAPVGTPCGENGMCVADGVCELAPGRTTDGQVALYLFDEAEEATVLDQSGLEPALDLTINPIESVTWGDGFLTVNAPATLSTVVGATRIRDAVAASDEITIEAWLAPDNLQQSGPARIATVSPDPGTRDATLGQVRDAYVARLRTRSGDRGFPQAVTPEGDVATELSHVVFTRSADGERRIYVDGILRSSSVVGGDLGNWDDYPLTVANEATGDRPWLGELHLVAIFSRALGALEVQQSYLAGPL